MVPLSSKTGEGLDQFRVALVEAAARTQGRPVNGVARLPIDRVFSMKGFGTVVTGTLVSGRIAVDDELMIAPGDRIVKVRGVQVHVSVSLRRSRAAVRCQHRGCRSQEISAGRARDCRRSVHPPADAVVELLPGASRSNTARVRPIKIAAEIPGGCRLQPGSSGVFAPSPSPRDSTPCAMLAQGRAPSCAAPRTGGAHARRSRILRAYPPAHEAGGHVLTRTAADRNSHAGGRRTLPSAHFDPSGNRPLARRFAKPRS